MMKIAAWYLTSRPCVKAALRGRLRTDRQRTAPGRDWRQAEPARQIRRPCRKKFANNWWVFEVLEVLAVRSALRGVVAAFTAFVGGEFRDCFGCDAQVVFAEREFIECIELRDRDRLAGF